MIIALIKYEQLTKYCHVCGMMGYAMRECSDVDEKKKVMERGQVKFGSWLKAPLLVRVKNFRQREDVPGSSRVNQSKKQKSPRANMEEDSNRVVSTKLKEVEKLALIEAKWALSCGEPVIGNQECSGIATGELLKKEERVGNFCVVKVGDDVLVTDMEGLEDAFEESNQQGFTREILVNLNQNSPNSSGIARSPNKLNIRKWKTAARKRSSSSVLSGFPSLIQCILPARQYSRRSNRNDNNSHATESPNCKIYLKLSPICVDEVGCKRKSKNSGDVFGEGNKQHREGEMGFLLETVDHVDQFHREL
ncbi:hypothetical protein ACOSP7_004634 [Xanthoceras sorbifolium]